MGKIDDLVEAIRGYDQERSKMFHRDEQNPYYFEITPEPNSNVYRIHINKMYDEDFNPVYISNVFGPRGVEMYKSAQSKPLNKSGGSNG